MGISYPKYKVAVVQAALIGSPNQIEAVRAGMEGRPGRFAD